MSEPLLKGDKVVMHTCPEASKHQDKVWKCKTDQQTLGGHTEVVWLEGYRGCFAVEYLKKVESCIICDKVIDEEGLCEDCTIEQTQLVVDGEV